MSNNELNVKLVDGDFTPVQAIDIISSLIQQKINFHKIENLQNWEKNHKADPEPFIKRINQLKEANETAKQFIIEMKKNGKRVQIEGNLSINIVD